MTLTKGVTRSEVIYAWYFNPIGAQDNEKSGLPEQIVIIHFQISITTPATSLISRIIKQLAKEEIVVG